MRTSGLRFVVSLIFAVACCAARAAPPTYEAIVKACDEADTAAQCERVLEKEQLKQFPGLGARDGPVLRIQRPGMSSVEFRDVGNPDDDNSAFRWHAFWDFWPKARIAIVSVTARDSDHFLVAELERGMSLKVPAEPILSPDGQRFLVSDFCDKGCSNTIQLWRIDRNRAVRDRTFRPRERWFAVDVAWRDPSTLAVDYSIAGPRRRLADPNEVNLVKADPMLLKLSDHGWIDVR